MCWLDLRVETHYFKVILIESDEVLSPLTLVCFYHSITLIVDLVLGDDGVAWSKHLIDMLFSSLGAE